MNNSVVTPVENNNKEAKRKNFGNKVQLFYSKPETPPYNTLTEEEKIAEGTRNPYLERPDFKKTTKEKKYLKKLRVRSKHKKFAGTSASSGGAGHNLPSRVTVYLHNNRTVNPNVSDDKNEKKHFPNVHTFQSTNPELDALLLAKSHRTTVVSIIVNGKKIK